MKNKIAIFSIVLSMLFFAGLVYLFISVSNASQNAEANNASLYSQEPVSTPVFHKDSNSPLIVIDASGIYDDGIIKKITNDLNDENYTNSQYIKCDLLEAKDIYEEKSKQNEGNIIIIAPNDILDLIETEYEVIDLDITDYSYVNLAKNMDVEEYMPFAMVMYGYYIRYDIAQELELYIPTEYGGLKEFCLGLRDDSGRYGFAVSSEGTFEQMMVEQMNKLYEDDGLSALSIIFDMWTNRLLPPNTAYLSDENCVQAYLDDAILMFYGDGYSLNEIYQTNPNLYEKTYVMQYIGKQPTFATRSVSIAVKKGSNTDIFYEFVKRLNENSDEIFKQNPGILPAVRMEKYYSPFKNAITAKNNVVYYEGQKESNLDKMIFYTMDPYEILGIKD